MYWKSVLPWLRSSVGYDACGRCSEFHFFLPGQELGCGCALVGMLAGRLGAARVVMTDCKDDALADLQRMVELPALKDDPSGCSYEVSHLLWQQDRLAFDHARVMLGAAGPPPAVAEAAATAADGPGPGPDILPADAPPAEVPGRWALEPAMVLQAASFAELPHWSSATRDTAIPALSPCEQFDLIIASDCLYFPDQASRLYWSWNRAIFTFKTWPVLVGRRQAYWRRCCCACGGHMALRSSYFSESNGNLSVCL